MENIIKIIIVRHGQTRHNAGGESKHTFAGSSIDNELNQDGIGDAQVLAETVLLKDKPEIIFCSGLKRSRQTAEIIAKVIQSEKKYFPKITEISELNEIDIGDFVGHTEDEVKRLYPLPALNFYEGNISLWNFPNGESYPEIDQRVKSALRKIFSLTTQGQTVLISGHGMLNRVLFFLLDSSHTARWKDRTYPHNRIDYFNINVTNYKL